MTIKKSKALALLGLLVLAALLIGHGAAGAVADGPPARRQLPRLVGAADRGGLVRLPRPADRPGAASPRRGLRRPEQGRGLPGHHRRRPRGRRVALFTLEGETSAGFRGLAWSPDGSRLFASTSRGYVQSFTYKDGALKSAATIRIQPDEAKGEPGPRRDGDHPRRLAALRRRRQPQRRRRDRPGDAQMGPRVPRADPALSSRGSRRTSGR